MVGSAARLECWIAAAASDCEGRARDRRDDGGGRGGRVSSRGFGGARLGESDGRRARRPTVPTAAAATATTGRYAPDAAATDTRRRGRSVPEAPHSCTR